LIRQKQWKTGVLLAVSVGFSGCSNQPDYCQGLTGEKVMDNLFYIKDNSFKVKSAQMIRAVQKICQQDTNYTDPNACFTDKLVGCGFPDKAVKTLTENNKSAP